MASGVSVLICSYNGASRLPKTLKHLALQKVPVDIPWEIIIIDNASTDNTTKITEEEWRKYPTTVGFRVLPEPNAGKNNALDKGINNALYDLILICDDDNWLNEDYVEKAYLRMQADDKIGAVGGMGIAVSDIELPAWFEQYNYAYAVGKQNSTSGILIERNYLWGAGMVFKKSLYKKIYLNAAPLLMGPNGSTWSPGEDVEFCFRVQLLGYKLYYDETLIYKHYLPDNRLTEEYRKKLMNGYSDEHNVLNLYLKMIAITRLNPLNRTFALCSGAIRYLITKVYTKSKWSADYESEDIYLLTGIELKQVSSESKQVKNVFNQLTAAS